MTDELYALFRRNFPTAVREVSTAKRILSDPGNRITAERDSRGRLIGASVIQDAAILLLCVDAGYRGRGIGSRLLAEAERAVWSEGHAAVQVGVGKDYLVPGVPTSRRYFEAENEALDPRLDTGASDFFEHRGYRHSWDCNCFDMRLSLADFSGPEWTPGTEKDGVAYRWAALSDRAGICACTDAAWPQFTPYYRGEAAYTEGSPRRVMLAETDGRAAGVLMVCRETEGPGLGSIGCTAVHPAYQGRHIAVNMVTFAASYLRSAGMESAFLGYTYTGLDHMYGYAGYKICTYYMMARKERP